MIKDRFLPVNYKDIFYCYDSQYGVIFVSDKDSNEVINKVNNGTYEENLLNDTVTSEKMKDILEFANKNKIKDEDMINIIRKKTCNSEKMWREGKILNKLWLSIAHVCNMRCEYCFAGGGSYGSEAIMTKEKAKECIDYFFKYFNKESKTISINFFGGEPLINKEVFIFATNYINFKIKGLSCKPKYILTTNCTNIDDEIIDIIIKNNMHLNISIDGRKDIQDKNRKFTNGTGTFDVVVKNIKSILKRYDNITARITLTKRGVSTLKKDIKFLWDLGIKYVYVAPVDSNNEELALNLYDLNVLDSQFEELLDMMIEELWKGNEKYISNIYSCYEDIENRMILKECKYYNPFTVMFSPEGDIYKCNRTLGNSKYKVGDIYNDVEWSKFKKEYVLDEKCLNCWAKRLCGGGCAILTNTDVSCGFKKIILYKSLKFYSYIQAHMDKLKKGRMQ